MRVALATAGALAAAAYYYISHRRRALTAGGRPAIYLVGGPSGAGKDTLLLGARERCADEPVMFIKRDVTRPTALCTELERSVDEDTFKSDAAAGKHALSWTAHESVHYAIPRDALEEALAASPPQRVVLNVSRSILDDVLRLYGDRADVFVLLISASAEALRVRLMSRGREDAAAIESRVAKATSYEPPNAGLGHRVVRVLNDTTVAGGVDQVRRALLAPCHVLVLGLVGCSAAGKSTLCEAAASVIGGHGAQGGFDRLRVVTCDDYYVPAEACPRFGLATEVRWPAGAVPSAFLARGDADMNHPDSICWPKVAAALDEAVGAAAAADAADGLRTLVVIEGLLLLGVGAEAVRRRVSRWVALDDRPKDAVAQEAFWRRKWQRSGHLGKKSYRERGVTAAEYARYWDDYVAPRWREHGWSRLEALTAECGGVAPPVAKLDCRKQPEELAVEMLKHCEGM